jgi:hypothetical protein
MLQADSQPIERDSSGEVEYLGWGLEVAVNDREGSPQNRDRIRVVGTVGRWK